MSAPEASKPLKVAIVGAGLTGLLTAHALKKNGFDVAVFEREHSIDARPRDWTILLHWALPIFTKLLPKEVVARLPEAICNPYLDFGEEAESLMCYNGDTGDVLFKNNLPGSRRISRQRLRRVLAEGIDVQWGKRLESIDTGSGSDTVRLAFKSGETFEADYVLGSDGARSKVRELLFHGDKIAEVQPSGFMFGTCIVDDPKDKSTWTTFWVKIWRRSAYPLPAVLYGPDALNFLKEKTSGLAQPFQSQVDWTPEDSTSYIDEMNAWVSVPFDTRAGRVTLAGDAAHPMLIYRGQGFQHAIMDANNYLDALVKIRDSGEAGETVISAYSDEMVERGAKAVKQSLQEAEFSMDLESIGKMLMAKQGHGKSTYPGPSTGPSAGPSPPVYRVEEHQSHSKERQDHQQDSPRRVDIEPAAEDDIEDEDEFAITDGYDTRSSKSTSAASTIYAHTFENGRRYQHFKNGRYPIPNDDLELNREDMKHAMLLEVTDGQLFYAPIGDNPQSILDIGTGTVGDQFPSARVRGVDLSPTQPQWVPPNVDFLVDDCEKDDWLARDVDLVHLRFMTIILKDVPTVLKRGYESLKPGGWIELQELCAEVLCDDGTMPPDDPVKYTYELAAQAFGKFGMRVTLPKDLEPLLRDAGYENIQCIVKKVPIGVWARDKTMRLVGMYQKMAVLDLLPAVAGRPFAALGMSEMESQVTLAHTRRGLNDASVHRYFHYYFWFAQKPFG
ncbi:hypothetical protein B0T25DRAFT_587903 [Lasiosphaeria hispida]|uniref:FAD-binding domain-containing protein n=1 Tax=Lasiosphaeria hispida TaxID=260671 RepID=A0AAJ0MHA0_9PEZI|nr:hypothetical protein B0T25DRAFT_587903 [Lasiosphaeria hispida]